MNIKAIDRELDAIEKTICFSNETIRESINEHLINSDGEGIQAIISEEEEEAVRLLYVHMHKVKILKARQRELYKILKTLEG